MHSVLIYIYIYTHTNLPVNATVRLPHPWSRGSLGQEMFSLPHPWSIQLKIVVQAA